MRIGSKVVLPNGIRKLFGADRSKLISTLNSSTFKSLMNEEALTFERIENAIVGEYRFVNRNNKPDCLIKLKVKDNPKRRIAYAQSDITFNDRFITGHEINIPTSNGVLPKDHLGILMHEITHTHNFMCEPKILQRAINFSENTKLLNQLTVSKYYNKFLNTPESWGYFDTRIAKPFLKLATLGMKPEQKLDALQLLRYKVKFEKLGYAEGEKYTRILESKGIKQKKGVRGEDFCFDEKIEFLEDEIKKLLSKMRNV